MDKPPTNNKENQAVNDQDHEGQDLFNEDEEFEFTNSGGQNEDDDLFDTFCGALQDIVIDPEFEDLSNTFLEKHCMVFEDEEENKFEYTTIFKDYQKMLEKYIESKLAEMVPGYDMKKFHQLLETRIDQIDPQILDLLMTCSDFEQFKEHMLSYKKVQMSKKKKSKKAQEAGLLAKENFQKIERPDHMFKMDSLDDAFDDLMISGTSKAITASQQLQVGGNSMKKDSMKQQGQQGPPPVTKKTKKASFDTDKQKGALDDVPLYTPKKLTNKANNDQKAKKKDNIFS